MAKSRATVTTFYNRYHQKNQRFFSVIKEPNFTYWYILKRLYSAFPQGFSTLKVLDVGCGVGTISLFLASKGATVKGIDISSRAVEIAQEAQKALRLPQLRFELGELQKGKGQYNLITCCEVIEHIPDEQTFARQLYSHLQPGGTLLLTTPSLNNVLYRVGFYTRFDQEVGHLRRYTPDTIRYTLTSVGFQVVSIHQVEGPLRNLLFTTKLGVLIRFIRGPLIPAFHWLDQLSGRLFGFSDLQVVAQKPAKHSSNT